MAGKRIAIPPAASSRLAIRRSADITLLALKLSVDDGSTAFRRDHPWAIDPRRIVACVLIVTALEFGNPVVFSVLVKAGDATFHVCLTSGLRYA